MALSQPTEQAFAGGGASSLPPPPPSANDTSHVANDKQQQQQQQQQQVQGGKNNKNKKNEIMQQANQHPDAGRQQEGRRARRTIVFADRSSEDDDLFADSSGDDDLFADSSGDDDKDNVLYYEHHDRATRRRTVPQQAETQEASATKHENTSASTTAAAATAAAVAAAKMAKPQPRRVSNDPANDNDNDNDEHHEDSMIDIPPPRENGTKDKACVSSSSQHYHPSKTALQKHQVVPSSSSLYSSSSSTTGAAAARRRVSDAPQPSTTCNHAGNDYEHEDSSDDEVGGYYTFVDKDRGDYCQEGNFPTTADAGSGSAAFAAAVNDNATTTADECPQESQPPSLGHKKDDRTTRGPTTTTSSDDDALEGVAGNTLDANSGRKSAQLQQQQQAASGHNVLDGAGRRNTTTIAATTTGSTKQQQQQEEQPPLLQDKEQTLVTTLRPFAAKNKPMAKNDDDDKNTLTTTPKNKQQQLVQQDGSKIMRAQFSSLVVVAAPRRNKQAGDTSSTRNAAVATTSQSLPSLSSSSTSTLPNKNFNKHYFSNDSSSNDDDDDDDCEDDDDDDSSVLDDGSWQRQQQQNDKVISSSSPTTKTSTNTTKKRRGLSPQGVAKAPGRRPRARVRAKSVIHDEAAFSQLTMDDSSDDDDNHERATAAAAIVVRRRDDGAAAAADGAATTNEDDVNTTSSRVATTAGAGADGLSSKNATITTTPTKSARTNAAVTKTKEGGLLLPPKQNKSSAAGGTPDFASEQQEQKLPTAAPPSSEIKSFSSVMTTDNDDDDSDFSLSFVPRKKKSKTMPPKRTTAPTTTTAATANNALKTMTVKRKRGRPRKVAKVACSVGTTTTATAAAAAAVPPLAHRPNRDDKDGVPLQTQAPKPARGTIVKRKRGRPRKKNKAASPVAPTATTTAVAASQQLVNPRSSDNGVLARTTQAQETAIDPGTKTHGRKRLIALKSTGAVKSSEGKPTTLEWGQRVYAKWMDGKWYWGIVDAIKQDSASCKYTVFYDDADSLDVVRENIVTVPKYKVLTREDPPPCPHLDHDAKGHALYTRRTLCPTELYARRCGKCELCTKADCGSCFTCRRNRHDQVSEDEREVCLQKMCLVIPDAQKKQPAVGFSPGWKFVFSADKPYFNKNKNKKPVPGLWIYHPDYPKLSYRSAEAAICNVPKLLEFNPNVQAEFNRHIGVKRIGTPTSGKKKAVDSRKKSPGESLAQIVVSRNEPATMTLRELYESRCGVCMNCIKDDCGQCDSCTSIWHEREVCLQKMCCRLPAASKAQPMPPSANFPDGYKFIIDPERTGYSGCLAPPFEGAFGLKILTATGPNEYYSVESLKAQKTLALKDVSADAFYEHIGAKPRSRHSRSTRSINDAKEMDQLYGTTANRKRCGFCANCKKEACGRCARCTSRGRAVDDGLCCLQNMCLEIPIEEKAEPAVGFPKGYRFYFAEHVPNRGNYTHKPVPGLFILSPNGGKVFRSVEGAVSTRNLNGDEIARQFYTHVGLTERLPKRVPKPAPTSTTRAALSNYRVVGSRVYYKTGKHGLWGTITEKLELSPNNYTFKVQLENDNTVLEDLPANKVFSEIMYKNKTGKLPPPCPIRHALDDDNGEQARPHKKQRTDESAAVKVVTTTDHHVVGRRCCFAWVDVQKNNKLLNGVVTECEKNAETDEAISFKVAYSAVSRKIANSIKDGCGSTVPENQMLPAPFVIGGCIFYEKRRIAASQSDHLDGVLRLHHWTFLNPDMRHEELLENTNGERLPRLTIAVKGFCLELNVKRSSIPNAGNGVFLKCTPLNMDDEDDTGAEPSNLVLKVGELLDLGTYGPFRMQDKKEEAVFFVKNFVHEHKCEEWAFNTSDSRYQLDITDDVTGDIHSTAKSHLPAYVNESNESFCIHAEHCPDGSVHYCLGHAYRSQGDFVVPSDGSEMEVFVNYGDDYEKVRFKKGYGFLPEKWEGLRKLFEEEDVVDVREMFAFGAAEVKACVDYFLGIVSGTDTFTSQVTIQRVLVCAVALRRRAWQLFHEREDDTSSTADDSQDDNTSESVNLRQVSSLSGRLTAILLNMLRDGEERDELKKIHTTGNVDDLIARVFKMHFSGEDAAKLANVMD